jgi:putative endonuclease
MSIQPCVYILASKRNGTLYTGVTGALPDRIYQHKSGIYKGFTKRYGVKSLVWYAFHDSMDQAITREKQIKFWKRKWKIELITAQNPEWRDLYDDLNK